MCGIAGYFAPKNNFSADLLERMTRCLAYRGPDAEGFYRDDTVGFGHRRLSIIDLSAAANQPLLSADGHYVIMFNGEIYNYKDIAAELHVPLKTHSDTEVMVEAFSKWGVEAVKRFNGMFTIALYDVREKLLTLFRDRFGVKPLFYFYADHHLFFASEIKSLMSVEQVRRNCTLNDEAIYWYLQFGYIPQPYTIWNEIKKFPAGHYLTLRNNDFEFIPYWKTEVQISKEVISNEEVAQKKLDELLQSSIEYRMISDVPFGTFLSGGIDSSLVTAIAQKKCSAPVNTFTIGFEEAKYNEAEHAKKIAHYLGTNHHEFYLSYKDALNSLDEALDLFDEPFADSSALPAMLLSMQTRKHVKMILSGDGGDELFMGYGVYRWAKRLSQPHIRSFRGLIALILEQQDDRSKRAAHLFRYPGTGKIKTHIFSQEQYFFSETEADELMKEKIYPSLDLNIEKNRTERKLSAAELQSLFDLDYYLKDDLLVKVDRASMHYALECRTPFLDYRLVSFALNVSEKLKMKNAALKLLPRKLLANYLPALLFERPKWGFAIPLKEWLQKELQVLIHDFLSKEIIERHGIVHFEPVEQMKKRFFKGESYLYNRLWNLIVLHRWLEKLLT